MQIGFDLSQSQTLKLKLTPELKQAIDILQYSSQELVDFIQLKTIENPILEISESSIENIFNCHHTPSNYSYNKDTEYDPFDFYSDTRISLEEYLIEQIMLLKNLSPLQIKIFKFLIGNLNTDGYLEINSADASYYLSVSENEVNRIINLLQTLEPIGVGARNLMDCLLIQMRANKQNQSLAYSIVENHLEDLAAKRYPKLAKILHVSVNEIQNAADYIATLDPKPCRQFFECKNLTQYVIPDIIIENVNGKLIIKINDTFLPTVSINEYYKNSLNNHESSEYLKKKYQDAMLLLNSLTHRKQTLFQVSNAIIEIQNEFFQFGLVRLRPMKLKDIAEKTGFHESTISRVTSNKFIKTNHGLYLLKNLFTTGIDGLNSESESSFDIKKKMEKLIREENKQKPFSDQQIVRLLENEGILLARRTVTKYRVEMGIPSSSKRKRY